MVCVLTDGSGRTGHSRLDSTTRVLNAIGCVRGSIYGAMTDPEIYAAVMDFKHARFLHLIDELASLLLREEVDCVAGDAEEGYNPAHDICRMLINAAATLVSGKYRRKIKNFDFTLIGSPGECPSELQSEAIYLRLDDRALARKLGAAHNYPELQAEVAAALSGVGSVGLHQHPDLATLAGVGLASADQFSVECLRPVESGLILRKPEVPFYEAYGERQVAAGHYARVLRYREHILPLADAISAHVQKLLNS